MIEEILEILSSSKTTRWTTNIVRITQIVLITIIPIVFLISISKDFEIKPKSATIEKHRTEFFKTTNEILISKDSSLVNIKTLKKVFNSIDRESNGLLFEYGFVNLLEDYLIYVMRDSTAIELENCNYILTMIEDEIEQAPFSQLNQDQKRVLVNINKALQDTNITIANYNLEELDGILRTQNENIRKLEKENNWSIPLAIVGAILTLLFGLISIFRPISYRQVNRMINKQLDNNGAQQ